MIRVSRLNSEPLVVNAELIETVEATPDTIITLVTGKKIVVADAVDSIVEKVTAYRREVGCQMRVTGRVAEDDPARGQQGV